MPSAVDVKFYPLSIVETIEFTSAIF